MIGYWILLLIIAFIAYNFGSISTLNIASVFVFHRDLHRIGKKSMFISNFRRLFGYTGFLKLLLVELIRDFVPILLGGILLYAVNNSGILNIFSTAVGLTAVKSAIIISELFKRKEAV